MITQIKGIQVTRIRITPTCRNNRTIKGAFGEAMQLVREKYLETVKVKANKNATFNLVLTVDRDE